MILVAFDGTAVLRRTLAGAPPLSRSDGVVTGSAVSFAFVVSSVMRKYRPTHALFAFDGPGPSFRKLLDSRYKGNREKAEFTDEQLLQMKMMRDFASSVGRCVDSAPYEADDVLASCANQFDGRVVVVAADKDAHQLVSKRVSVHDWTRDKGTLVDEAYVLEKWKVPAHLVADVQALAGDGVDGVGGVRGVGVKTAAALVKRLGCLEAVAADAASFERKSSMGAVQQADAAIRSAKLVRLCGEVPLPDVDDLRVRGSWVRDCASIAKALEADRLVANLSTNFRTSMRDLRPDPRWSTGTRKEEKSAKKLFGARA